jgi:hypothetical protein
VVNVVPGGTAVPAVSLERCGRHLDPEVAAMHSWYIALSEAVVQSDAVPPPHTVDEAGRRRLLDCVRDAVAADGQAALGPALGLLRASEHLGILRQIEEHLHRHAEEPRP